MRQKIIPKIDNKRVRKICFYSHMSKEDRWSQNFIARFYTCFLLICSVSQESVHKRSILLLFQADLPSNRLLRASTGRGLFGPLWMTPSCTCFTNCLLQKSLLLCWPKNDNQFSLVQCMRHRYPVICLSTQVLQSWLGSFLRFRIEQHEYWKLGWHAALNAWFFTCKKCWFKNVSISKRV